jgi:predicted nucleic acid-binding protein
MTLVYVGTNIIMDFLFNRNSYSTSFLMKSLNGKYRILISDLVLTELKHQDLILQASNFIKVFEGRLVICKTTSADASLANNLLKKYNSHYNDVLHMILAKKHGAEVIVTQNIKDFVCFDGIKVSKPDFM